MKFPDNTESDLRCPHCDPTRRLIVKTNRHTDHQFLGCPNYPACDYTRPIPEEWIMRASGQPGLFDGLTDQERSEYTQEFDTFSDADPGL